MTVSFVSFPFNFEERKQQNCRSQRQSLFILVNAQGKKLNTNTQRKEGIKGAMLNLKNKGYIKYWNKFTHYFIAEKSKNILILWWYPVEGF